MPPLCWVWPLPKQREVSLIHVKVCMSQNLGEQLGRLSCPASAWVMFRSTHFLHTLETEPPTLESARSCSVSTSCGCRGPRGPKVPGVPPRPCTSRRWGWGVSHWCVLLLRKALDSLYFPGRLSLVVPLLTPDPGSWRLGTLSRLVTSQKVQLLSLFLFRVLG